MNNIFNEIKELRTWPDGWNSYGAAKPREEAIINALDFVEREELTSEDFNVTAGDAGDVVLETWSNIAPYGKKLTVYIGAKGIIVYKVSDGEIVATGKGEDIRSSLEWLRRG